MPAIRVSVDTWLDTTQNPALGTRLLGLTYVEGIRCNHLDNLGWKRADSLLSGLINAVC